MKKEKGEHAVCSASSSRRWMGCPLSARLESLVDDNDSKESAEGTLAHAYAESILTGRKMNLPFEYDYIKDPVQEYVSYVYDLYSDALRIDALAKRYHEVKLDFSEYVPDGFGTGDTIIISDRALHVVDLKFGKGVAVSANDNPQLKLYGLGALAQYGYIYDIENVYLHIVQPRTEAGGSVFKISVAELVEWGNSIKESAKKAFEGDGEAVPGEYCQFCKVAGVCRVRANYAKELSVNNLNFALLGVDEIRPIYEISQKAKDYASALEKYILSQLLAGKKIPGLALGTARALSRWTSVEQVENTIKEQLPEIPLALIYKPKELVGLTEMKNILKKKYKVLEENGCIIKPSGGPKVVLEEDCKTPYAETIKNDFDIIKEGE